MTRAAPPGVLLEFEHQADTLRALAHPKRLMILDRLGVRAQSVGTLAHALGMSLPNASQHLRVLRDRGIVRADRSGHAAVYRLVDPAFHTCCTLVRQLVADQSRLRGGRLTAPPPRGAPTLPTGGRIR